jgi:uncharacterized protein (TIGR00297 family)
MQGPPGNLRLRGIPLTSTSLHYCLISPPPHPTTPSNRERMDLITDFARTHIPQITGTTLVVSYALRRKKFTPDGVLAGIAVSLIHMIHPWPAFYWLLNVFVVLGVLITKIGHDAKAHLTLSSTGGGGGEGARTSAQVLANSGTACILILVHVWLLNSTPFTSSILPASPGPHFPALQRILPFGIVAQYAAVAADTFGSELGILSKGQPFLITVPWKRVPKGTNGGVTVDGLLWGVLGSFLLTAVAGLSLWALPPHFVLDLPTVALLTGSGLFGSVIDSLLGAVVQATITDKKTGKVVEAPGGQRVKIIQGGSRAQMGLDLLTNNGVNFAMAASTSLLAMGAAYVLDLGM